MGVTYTCECCEEEDEAGEFEKVDDEHICKKCQDKAIRLGIKILKEMRKMR